MDFAEVSIVRRDRRFPVKSAIVVFLLLGVVLYLSYMDVDVPARAISQVGQAVTQLGSTLGLIGSEQLPQGDSGGQQQPMQSFIFAPGHEPTQAPEPVQMPLLVNGDNPLPERYSPTDLVLMRAYCDESVVYIKGSEIEGDRTAVDALMAMFRAAIADGLGDWQISAGYRSVSYQQTVWDNQVYKYRQDGLSREKAETATAKYVAKPGCSEHHTGLAFDVTVPGESFPLTKQSKWLAENCWDYGFIIRYTEEKVDLTGINAEPWHVRYVGQPHAQIMRDNNWCLEEYIAQAGI